jgi:hypothetical protein
MLHQSNDFRAGPAPEERSFEKFGLRQFAATLVQAV